MSNKPDTEEVAMPFEEKVTWVSAIVAAIVPAVYFAVVLDQLGAVAASEIAYQRPLLIAVGVSIALTIVGSILMGIGSGSGENRAVEAAEKAIASPLLEETITGAKGIIFNVTGGSDLTLYEVNEAAEVIYNAGDPDANIIFGATIDEKLQGEVTVTVIATGFKAALNREKESVSFIRPRQNQPVQPKPAADSHKDDIELPPFMR